MLKAGAEPCRDRLKTEYDKLRPRLERLEEEAKFILSSKLKKQRVKIHSVSSRVKDFSSVYDKLQRKSAKTRLHDINDLVGLRVVCLFLSDIEKIGRIIKKEFNVVYEDNRIEGYEVSSFGYMSVHFIAQIKDEYSGPRYDMIKGQNFEIQIHTVLMDVWAVISHYLTYKQDIDVPRNLVRDFYALSGLFYVADTHFELFYKASEESRRKTVENVKRRTLARTQEINSDSVAAYLDLKFPDREKPEPKDVSELVTELTQAGYQSIAEVDRAVKKASEAFAAAEKERPPEGKRGLKFAQVGALRNCLDLVDKNFLKLRAPEFWQEAWQSEEEYRKLVK